MKQLFLFLAFIAIGATAAMAQDTTDKFVHSNDNKFEFNLDMHYTLKMAENDTWHSGDDKAVGRSFRASVLYRFLPRLKAGVGIGLEKYGYKCGYSTRPIFLAVQYAPLKKDLKPYLFSNIGYSKKSTDISFVGGWLAEVGVGYKIMFRKHFGLKFEAGYNLQTFELNKMSDGFSDVTRHSLTAGVGLVF